MLFQEALFSGKRWQELTQGRSRDATVVMSGVPGPVSVALFRSLTGLKLQRERILSA